MWSGRANTVKAVMILDLLPPDGRTGLLGLLTDDGKTVVAVTYMLSTYSEGF